MVDFAVVAEGQVRGFEVRVGVGERVRDVVVDVEARVGVV